MRDAVASRLAALIQGLVRERVTVAPAPRTLPYLGLEHASGTGLHLLDRLSARGIFRKYEVVLEVAAGLGGRARWIAARLGCDVIGTADVDEVEAGSELTRRAATVTRVSLVAAAPTALPFGSARFTHVWFIETLPQLGDVTAVLAEAHRVVRPGGWLAVQELVRGAGLVPSPLAARDFTDAGARAASVVAAGFVDVDVRDVTADAAERSAQVLAARGDLLRRLEKRPAEDGGLLALAAERTAFADAFATGALRVVQLLARAP